MDDSRDVRQQTDPFDGPTAPTLSDETDNAGAVAELTDDGESGPDSTTEEDATEDCLTQHILPTNPLDDPFECIWPGTRCDSFPEYRCSDRVFCQEFRVGDPSTWEVRFEYRCAECTTSALCPWDRPYCDLSTYTCIEAGALPKITCLTNNDCIPFVRQGFTECVPGRNRCLPPKTTCSDVFDAIVSWFDEELHICLAQPSVIDWWKQQLQADPAYWETDTVGSTE